MGFTTIRRRHAVLAVVAALALGCGGGASDATTGIGTGGGGGGGGGSTSDKISVQDNSFSPSATTVPKGTTVTWTWTGANPHNVTFDDGTASSTQSTGTYDRKFDTAGTYPYHCTVHGTIMSGTVTVQ